MYAHIHPVGSEGMERIVARLGGGDGAPQPTIWHFDINKTVTPSDNAKFFNKDPTATKKDMTIEDMALEYTINNLDTSSRNKLKDPKHPTDEDKRLIQTTTAYNQVLNKKNKIIEEMNNNNDIFMVSFSKWWRERHHAKDIIVFETMGSDATKVLKALYISEAPTFQIWFNTAEDDAYFNEKKWDKQDFDLYVKTNGKYAGVNDKVGIAWRTTNGVQEQIAELSKVDRQDPLVYMSTNDGRRMRLSLNTALNHIYLTAALHPTRTAAIKWDFYAYQLAKYLEPTHPGLFSKMVGRSGSFYNHVVFDDNYDNTEPSNIWDDKYNPDATYMKIDPWLAFTDPDYYINLTKPLSK